MVVVGLRRLELGKDAPHVLLDRALGDPEPARDRAGGLRPDVVLVDVDLAAESGFELARRLHEQPRGAATQVILISTHDPDDFAELIASSPAVGFLAKSELSASAIGEPR